MADTVGDVAIGITADIGPLIRETNRAKAVMSGFQGAMQRMGGGLGKVSAIAGDLGAKMSLVTAALAGVVGVAIAVTRNAASMGDAIGDGAKAAGMGTTAFQEYRFAIKEAADMTDDEFASAMVKLNKSLGDAQSGSKSAVSAFEKIGISQADIASGSVNTESALAAFVKKMEETKDPAEAAAMAADLFGKAGAGIGASLSGVPGQVGDLVDRARELGIVMGDDAVQQSSDFKKKMEELGAQFEATKLKIAIGLLPFLNNTLLPFLSGTMIPGIQSVIEKVAGWVQAFVDLPGPVKTALEVLGVAIGAGGPVMIALSVLTNALRVLTTTGALGAFMLVATSGAAVWQIWGDDIKKYVGGAIDYLKQKFQGILDFFESIITKAKEVGTAISDALSVGNPADVGGTSGYGGMGTASGDDLTDMFSGGGTGGSNSSSTGTAIADDLVNGMGARLTERMPEIQAMVQSVIAKAKEILGVASPSTVFAEIGGFIGEGLANGIKSTQGMVGAAVSAMGVGAVTASNVMVSDILSGLDTLFAGSQKAGAAIALVNTFIGASQEIKKGTFGFASAAKVVAQGMAFVKAIKGAKGGGGASRGGGSGGGAAAAPQQPVQNLGLSFVNDPFGIGENVARQIAKATNEAQRNGIRLNVSVFS